jgi:hypothetical protein
VSDFDMPFLASDWEADAVSAHQDPGSRNLPDVRVGLKQPIQEDAHIGGIACFVSAGTRSSNDGGAEMSVNIFVPQFLLPGPGSRPFSDPEETSHFPSDCVKFFRQQRVHHPGVRVETQERVSRIGVPDVLIPFAGIQEHSFRCGVVIPVSKCEDALFRDSATDAAIDAGNVVFTVLSEDGALQGDSLFWLWKSVALPICLHAEQLFELCSHYCHLWGDSCGRPWGGDNGTDSGRHGGVD